MPLKHPDQGYLAPYREAVKRFGPSFEATLWGTEEAQLLRFDVMIEMAGLERSQSVEPASQRPGIPMDGLAPSILDIGCGRGDLARRLVDRAIAFSRYHGIDALPEMIDAAKRRGLPLCTFNVMDVLRDLDLGDFTPDYVLISGTLNTMDEESARSVVRAAFEIAAQGVAFNFLSNRHDPKWDEQDLGPARRFDTVAWLDWAMSLTPRVSFTQEYMAGHDATILMRH